MMNLIDVLKANWIIFNLDAPIFSWVAAIILLIWPFFELIRLSYKARVIKKTVKVAVENIENIQKQTTVRPGEGLSLSMFDSVNRFMTDIPYISNPWKAYRSRIIRNANFKGEDSFWASGSSAATINEQSIVDSYINRRYFTALPGVVTGLGLLFTFLAILVALLEVKFVNEKIVGINLLIQGLSGKFVSSVAALFSATIYLLFETRILHRVASSIKTLNVTVDDLIPTLSAGQIVVDIRKDINEQSNAFRIFNADLSLKLKNSMSESIGPILERMALSVEELNRLIRESEVNKGDTITTQIKSTLQSLEHSMTSSLEKIGDSFSTTLTGSAKNQFDKMAEALGDTASFLKDMNNQFVAYQASMNDLISHAKTATSEQISLGQSQVNELSDTLRLLMENLNNTVEVMSSRMAKTIEDSSTKTTSSAKEIIEVASNLSAHNADRFQQLLEKHKGELDRISDIDSTLNITLSEFQDTIKVYRQVTTDLGSVSKEINSFVAAISKISKDVKDGQDAIQRVSVLISSQVENLKGVNQEQKEAWRMIHGSMAKYQETFGKVEEHARSLLTQIAENMNSYTSLTRKHLVEIIGRTDNLVGDAVGRLSGSIDELQEQLDELNETVDKVGKVLQRVK